MKKLAKALVAAMLISSPLAAEAFNLQDLLGNAGAAISGAVEGLLTKEDITVADMVGTWTATGSAVTFQSENFLKKAGGSAAAGTIEAKLNPYYEQYGLTGSTITIEQDGTFALKVKGMTIKGTITKRSDGFFDFSFTPFGSFKLGSVKTYVQKPVGGLDIMFDAKKLKSIISTIAAFTGNSLAKTASSVLDSYDGMCVGFAYKGSGNNSNNSSGGLFSWPSNNTNTTTTTPSTPATPDATEEQKSNGSIIPGSEAIKSVGEKLKGIFGF